jgi:hypothetical protein
MQAPSIEHGKCLNLPGRNRTQAENVWVKWGINMSIIVLPNLSPLQVRAEQNGSKSEGKGHRIWAKKMKARLLWQLQIRI